MMNEQTDTTRATRTRRTVLTGAAAAAVASVFATARADAAGGDPVRLGRVNDGGRGRTTLTSEAVTTLRVMNSTRGGVALRASSGFGDAASVLTSHRNRSGLFARNGAPRTGGGAAVEAFGKHNHGVVGSTTAAVRYGLLARNSATTAGRAGAAVRAEGGRNHGVVGVNNTNRSGVAGLSANGAGVSGLGHFGVYGLADTAADWGVVSDGDARVTGNLYVDGVIIDGRLASVSGTVSLDANGTATVVPQQATARGRAGFDYQLTAIGAPMPNLHVIERRDDSFQIAGGQPGGRVSWHRGHRSGAMSTTAASSPKPRPDLAARREQPRAQTSVD
jgi:hypothetical protein